MTLRRLSWIFTILAFSSLGFAGEETETLKEQIKEVFSSDLTPGSALKKDCDGKEDEKVVPSLDDTMFFFDLAFQVSNSNGQQETQGTRIYGVDLHHALGWLEEKGVVPREDFKKMTYEQQRSALYYYGAAMGLDGQSGNQSIKNAHRLFKGMELSEQGEQAVMDYIATEFDGASFGEKNSFLSSVLGAFDRNYDDSRNQSGHDNSTGSVSADEMLYQGFLDVQGLEHQDAGVCRDMHQAAVRMARAMGMNQAYGVSYMSRKSYHLNMVVSDPDDRTKTYILNYGTTNINHKAPSSEALAMHDIDDNGYGYMIWGKNNNPVLYVPNSRGGVLNMVAGGSDEDFDPMYGNQAVTNQAGIDYNNVIFGEYGVVGFSGSRHGDEDNTNTLDVDERHSIETAGLFTRVNHGYNLKLVDSDNFKLRTYGNLHVIAGVQQAWKSSDPEGKALNFEVNGRVRVGGEAVVKHGDVTSITIVEQRLD